MCACVCVCVHVCGVWEEEGIKIPYNYREEHFAA